MIIPRDFACIDSCFWTLSVVIASGGLCVSISVAICEMSAGRSGSDSVRVEGDGGVGLVMVRRKRAIVARSGSVRCGEKAMASSEEGTRRKGGKTGVGAGVAGDWEGVSWSRGSDSAAAAGSGVLVELLAFLRPLFHLFPLITAVARAF